MIHRFGVPTVFLLMAGSAMPAQQPAPNVNVERMANDAYSRSHDYDLIHQRISVRDFNWDSLSLRGSVATTLVALRPNMDSVILDAGALLNIRRVSNGRTTFATARRGDTLVVRLAKPAAFHDTVRFTIDYDGTITQGNGLTFIKDQPHAPREIWSQGEDHNNHYWFPTYDFPNDKMTWELEATVPKEYDVVSNGRWVSDTPARNGDHTVLWSEDRPNATYLVSIIVAPLAKTHDSWKGIPVDYYTYHPDSALAWRLFHVTPDMIDTYSTLTGVPYPWQKYAQTTVADFFGGMENVSATTLVDWMPDARAYQDRPWYQYLLIPHELAHQWFGDYVTTENWANMWLNEGFAEFMPGQYWLWKKGEPASEDYYADEYRSFMNIERRKPMPLASNGSNNIYPKGALVLAMLHEYLGDQRFWAGVHRYLVDHAYGNATSDDLRQAFLDATGENLDWFWREWVYSAGYPSFVVTANYDNAAHRLTLIARQTQRDSLTADSTGMRYVIPEAFTLPVTIRVGTPGADQVWTRWIRQREDTIVIDSLMAPPSMVVFDAGNQILKSLEFQQPTGWLATQLERDPNLWDREWVLSQLVERKSDALAGAAVAKALTSADYAQTRAIAATGIDVFGAGVAIPALEHAVHDSSAQVRAAAVGALGQVGGSRATELARGAWTSDSSYEVRAAALTALARLDAGSRHDLIAQGLQTPSYRDAIQNAALSAIARSGDQSFDDQVQTLVGDQANPSYLLAALARAADRHAQDLLQGNLDDPRPFVRNASLNAIRALPKNDALTILRSAQPRLTHADIQRAVARAIEQLSK